MKKLITALAIAMMSTLPFTAHATDRVIVGWETLDGPLGKPITMADFITVVINNVDGNQVLMMTVRSVASRDGRNRIDSGTPVSGTITSRPKRPGDMRVAICIDTIGKPGAVTIEPKLKNSYPHKGCIGQLHDAAGASGLPVQYLKPGARGHIYLNGDLYVNASINAGSKQ